MTLSRSLDLLGKHHGNSCRGNDSCLFVPVMFHKLVVIKTSLVVFLLMNNKRVVRFESVNHKVLCSVLCILSNDLFNVGMVT